MKNLLTVLLATLLIVSCKNTPDPQAKENAPATQAPINMEGVPEGMTPANQTKPNGEPISISQTDIVGMEKSKINGKNVSIRSGASIKSEKTGTFEDQEAVEVITFENVRNEGEAIISESITVKGSGGTVTLPKGKAVMVENFDAEKNTYTVSYEDPKKGRLEAQISASAVQTITYATWFNVKRKNGETGWVLGKFLQTN